MNYRQNSPYDMESAINGFNNLFDETISVGMDMAADLEKIKALDRLHSDKETVFVDCYGCEKLFVDFFVNQDMEEDFPIIARDFLIHELANTATNEDIAYFNMDSGDDWPESLFSRYIMGLMINAVNSGSEYTKALILHLYKTYYKKEYKSLKRFSTISAREIDSLAHSQESPYLQIPNMARILYMSKLSGIKLKDDCRYVYDFLSGYVDHIDKPGHSFANEVEEEYKASVDEINERFDINRLYTIYDKTKRFLGNSLQWLGYNPNYVDWCDANYYEIVDWLAITLSILKKTYPHKSKEYSAEELVVYSLIIQAASAATSNQDSMITLLRMLTYGRKSSGILEDVPSLFNPEDVKVKEEHSVKPSNEPERNESKEQKAEEMPVYSEQCLLEEIETLRRKVHKLSNDNSILRSDLSDKKNVDAENKTIKTQMECYKRELAALREYVYNLTESENAENTESIKEMKEKIADKRIIIIGGHIKWVSKLKKEFPKWEYINPDASGTTAVSIVNNAEMVYFFTDLISHSRYNQFMNTVQTRKIRFGYIHGVNIDNNIRDIYRDFSK
ncbi:MAG: hypothetical protein K6F84_04470 [Lachnospiraceae bacterium]|nr:hypothetical protein [Lachnospiraceae bacterium]